MGRTWSRLSAFSVSGEPASHRAHLETHAATVTRPPFGAADFEEFVKPLQEMLPSMSQTARRLTPRSPKVAHPPMRHQIRITQPHGEHCRCQASKQASKRSLSETILSESSSVGDSTPRDSAPYSRRKRAHPSAGRASNMLPIVEATPETVLVVEPVPVSCLEEAGPMADGLIQDDRRGESPSNLPKRLERL